MFLMESKEFIRHLVTEHDIVCQSLIVLRVGGRYELPLASLECHVEVRYADQIEF